MNKEKRQQLNINFVDMWPDFQPKNNFFFDLLSKRFELIISEEPEIVICSCYGKKHFQFKCAKLFYTAENWKTNFNQYDYSISFEDLSDSRQYKLPYFVVRTLEANGLEHLEKNHSKNELKAILASKESFCCTVVTNGKSKIRNDFFERLDKVKAVNSGGKFQNNIGAPIEDKNHFCKKHKFVFAFENETAIGYCTEKITDAFLADAIPIYYGDPLVSRYFNPKRFINYSDFETPDELISKILEIDSDDRKYIEMISEPVFNRGITHEVFNMERLLNFIVLCIEDSKNRKPVSQTYKSYFAWISVKFVNAKRKILN